MSASVQKTRYKAIMKLDAGGMAEIFIGKGISVSGIEKTVAIKRVLPSLCQNKKFIRMFLDEARLSMRLNHANIVQIFDVGKVEDTYFIVMEYVDGYNLRKVLQRLNELGRSVPVKISIYIITEVLKALSNAHDLKENGKSLGIVHRDVSPPNILISRAGETKITDFGLAKAATHAETTDKGIIKGKYSYLAPEATEGKIVDYRADIFAVGIVLWELLANRRLFFGATDTESVELIKKCHIPSLTELNPEVTPDLEKIVFRSLARDPRKRFLSCKEMGESLSDYLFSKKMRVTSFDLASFLREMFEEEGKADSESITRRIEEMMQEEIVNLKKIQEESGQKIFDGTVPVIPDYLKVHIKEKISYREVWKEGTTKELHSHMLDFSEDVSISEMLEGKDVSQTGEIIPDLEKINPGFTHKKLLIIAGIVLAVLAIGYFIFLMML
jgi:serine/threonine-protein kinase